MPHFIVPKFFSFIITVHDSNSKNETEKCETNESKTKNLNRPNENKSHKKSSSNKSKNKCNKIVKNAAKNNNETIEKKTVDPIENSEKIHLQKTQLNIELKEVQSFGSVDLIPVTNTTKSELKVHEKPVKNFVEITPLVNSQNEKAPLEKSCGLVQQKEQSSSQGF